MSGRRGQSLLEVMVAMVLGLLILGLGLALYQFSVREWSRLSSRAELQQMAAMALNRIAGDARDSAPGGVSEVPDGSCLGLVRLQDVGSDRSQIWEEQLVLYTWSASEGILWRRLRATEGKQGKGPPLKLTKNHPTRLPPPLVRLVASEPDGEQVCVARGVVAFEARLAGAVDSPAQPLSLSITLEKPILHARPERFELTRNVYLRNSP